MPPGWRAAAAAMASPRAFTSASASPKPSAPVATSAVYSPRLWPSATSKTQAAVPQHAQGGHRVRQQRRLGDLGARELLGRAHATDAGQVVAEHVAGLGEGVAGDGEGVAEIAAHARGLRPLAGEQDGDHGRAPPAAGGRAAVTAPTSSGTSPR